MKKIMQMNGWKGFQLLEATWSELGGQGTNHGHPLLEIRDIQIHAHCMCSLFNKEPLKGFGVASVHGSRLLRITSPYSCSCVLHQLLMLDSVAWGLVKPKGKAPPLCPRRRKASQFQP